MWISDQIFRTTTNIYSNPAHILSNSPQFFESNLDPAKLQGLKVLEFSDVTEYLNEAAQYNQLISRFYKRKKLTPAEYAIIASSLAWMKGGRNYT